jgi:hypothetical protein
MEINLTLRSEILGCSLNIEKSINDLLLLYLGLYGDNKNTRLFGNKPGITFNNKIDLLYDLQILSKAENSDFVLLMNFRNKFLHDIDCISFSSVFEQLDNSIKNKFKNFLNDGDSIDDEEACLSAFRNLYLKNIRVLLTKIEVKKKRTANKADVLHAFIDEVAYQIDIFYDFINELLLSIEKEDMADEKVQKVIKTISAVCEKYMNKYSTDEKYLSLKEKQQEFLSDSDMQKEFWNIVKFDNLKSKLDEFWKEANE